MKFYKEVTVEELSGIQCDVCKTIYTDKIDTIEFLCYEDTAGYGAKYFSDGDTKSLDLCERCTFGILRNYIKVEKGF